MGQRSSPKIGDDQSGDIPPAALTRKDSFSSPILRAAKTLGFSEATNLSVSLSNLGVHDENLTFARRECNPEAPLMSRLHSQQSGNGPILVMLHGLFGDLDNFRSVALHMERGLSIVRMDLPGHGKSPSNESLTLENMAELVLDELAALGIRQYHLLGHSLGGKVAMAIAGNPRAKGLQRLCIVDIAPKQYPPHHQEIFDALLSIQLDVLEDRRQADAQLKSAVTDAGVRAFLLKGLYQHESKRFRWRFDLKQLAADYPNISRPPTMQQRVGRAYPVHQRRKQRLPHRQ